MDSQYCSMPSGPFSRPMPEFLCPPNGAPGSNAYMLTASVPVRILLAISIAFGKSVVYTLPASPYAESLAMRIASSSVSKGITASTGPKISSWAMVIELSTSAKTRILIP